MSEPPFWVELSKNPKGIPPQSPGLRGTSYPGFLIRVILNRNAVVSIDAPDPPQRRWR